MTSAPREIPRRAVISWVLYDLANTIFSMGVTSSYFSMYVRESVGRERADSLYGLITAISMGTIFVIAPLLGAMTDRARRRMPFLVWSTLICCGCTAFLARGPFALSAVLFVLANAAYQAGLQFYDSLLPEVTTERNRGRISGLGISVGYLGSYVAIGLGLIYGTGDKAMLFMIIAVAFAIIATPCFLFVRERENRNVRPIFGLTMLKESTAQTLHALRSGHEYPGLLRFLLGRVFYMDAINTVIAYMFLYTQNVAEASGLTPAQGEQQAKWVMMAAITCAVAGGYVCGRAVDAKGPRRILNSVLWLWIGTFALAAAVGAFRLPIVALFVVAGLAGIGLGGIQAADRPYLLRLAPPNRIGEFYGLYGMVGRFSYITGPLIWGAIMYWTVERGHLAPLTGQAFAIVSLLVMVVIGYGVLQGIGESRNR